MQVILGSGGAIGIDLALELTKFTDKIRLVSRKPQKVNLTDELFVADLMNLEQTISAISGAEVVYLVAGLQYKTEIWQKNWHILMSNVINACKEHSSKLVFFDNVYMYGQVNGWMTEETPINPNSKKGEVRAKIASQLLDEIKKGNLKGLIARSADFYGPLATNTATYPMIFQKFKDGKKATWMVNDKVKHSMTFTPDAAKATALLGNTIEAYNQVWHLPTDKNTLTGKQFIELSAKIFGVEPNYSVLSKFLIKIAGFVNPIAKESIEMLYQLEYDYLFSSSKFENKFFLPTSYSDGLKTTKEKML